MLEGRHSWTSTVRQMENIRRFKVYQMCKLSSETMEPDMDTDQSL